MWVTCGYLHYSKQGHNELRSSMNLQAVLSRHCSCGSMEDTLLRAGLNGESGKYETGKILYSHIRASQTWLATPNQHSFALPRFQSARQEDAKTPEDCYTQQSCHCYASRAIAANSFNDRKNGSGEAACGLPPRPHHHNLGGMRPLASRSGLMSRT